MEMEVGMEVEVDGIEQAIGKAEQELRGLRHRISVEQRAWCEHLRRVRTKAAPKLDISKQFWTKSEAARQYSILDAQIEAYNIRIAANRERGANHPVMTLADLIPEDEARLVATETPNLCVRRLVITGRLTLSACSVGLRQLEDQVTSAFVTLGKMLRQIVQCFDEGMEEPVGNLWRLVSDVECMALGLKASMAKMGIKMPRQRIIVEFFEIVQHPQGVDDVLSAPLSQADDGTNEGQRQEHTACDAETAAGEEKGGYDGLQHPYEDGAECMGAQVGEDDDRWSGCEEPEQTFITEYFMPV